MSEKGFLRVLEEVGGEVVRECEEIVGRGLREAEEVVEREKAAALERIKSIIYSAERKRETIWSRSMSLAEVKARGVALQAMEEYMEKVLEEALRAIREMAERGELAQDLKKVLSEAVEAVGSPEVEVHTASHLLGQLKRAAQELEREKGVKIIVSEEPVETAFGVIAKSPDGTISYDNRVETRAARARSRIKREITSLLEEP